MFNGSFCHFLFIDSIYIVENLGFCTITKPGNWMLQCFGIWHLDRFPPTNLWDLNRVFILFSHRRRELKWFHSEGWGTLPFWLQRKFIHIPSNSSTFDNLQGILCDTINIWSLETISCDYDFARASYSYNKAKKLWGMASIPRVKNILGELFMFLTMHNHIFGKNRCHHKNKEETISNCSTFRHLEIQRLEERYPICRWSCGCSSSPLV